MSTGIEWTDETWNPLRGCSRKSQGCVHCYAEPIAARFSGKGQPYEGLAHFVTRPDGSREARWTGKVAMADDRVVTQPLRWRNPRMIFVNSMSDLFHEDVPDEWIDRVFAVMALAPQHTFQILTKRPERMRTYFTDYARQGGAGPIAGWHIWRINQEIDRLVPMRTEASIAARQKNAGGHPLPNVWLGVSTEDQATADERIPILLDTPAAVRWISAEPLLGPIDLRNMEAVASGRRGWSALADPRPGHATLDWVIVGGESGPHARPMHPDWARSLRDQCQEAARSGATGEAGKAGVPFFFKQWGLWGPDDGPPDDSRDSIMEGRARCAWWDGNQFHYAVNGYAADLDRSKGEWLYALGKNATGRFLDGRTWDEYPRRLA
jgi:protein gp37